jgi:hypothetical protein
MSRGSVSKRFGLYTAGLVTLALLAFTASLGQSSSATSSRRHRPRQFCLGQATYC